jgi:cell division protein FtsB
MEDIPLVKKFEIIFGLSVKVFLATAVVVIALGIYIANLIYGDNSLHRLEYLKKQEIMLKHEIKRLKEENAKLHKLYLEWNDVKNSKEP